MNTASHSAAAPVHGPAGSVRPAPRLPPLENGDHLTRDEFERRYAAMPPDVWAELIEGVVHMSCPVRQTVHGKPHAAVMGWLSAYWFATPGTELGDNASVRLDLDNEPQPDALLFVQPDFGGRVRIGPEGYIEGAPELVAEVAASTSSLDLNAKMRAYRRNGVDEYLVWRVLDGAIDWFALVAGQYERIAPDDAGILHSRVFPGLRLDPAAMLRFDLPRVRAVLAEGIASPEHAAFAERPAVPWKPG
jgi:Uma2 family endonuclease